LEDSSFINLQEFAKKGDSSNGIRQTFVASYVSGIDEINVNFE
jgi:hypothetical protein